jgi:hypothetical protein
VKGVIAGRKHCTCCTRWRHWTDFGVHTWTDRTKTVPKRLQSWCHVCRRRYGKRHRANLTEEQKARIRATNRVHQRRLERRRGAVERIGGAYVKTPRQRDTLVERWPFARWLREQKAIMGTGSLARRTGIQERRITAIISGYAMSKGHGRLKWRAMDWIEFDTVDAALTKFGEPWMIDELYPFDASTDKSLLDAA